MSYADFMLHASGIQAARDIFREAISAVPNVIGLRLGFADLEEIEGGGVEAPKDIIRQVGCLIA